MPVRHAAAVFLDQLPRADARGGELHAGVLDAAGHRKAAQSLAVAPAIGGEPGGALFHDVADPEQRLDVLLQRWPSEQADLGDVGRTMARQAALALDRLDHRGLFAADI